jgi:hypothetical protein
MNGITVSDSDVRGERSPSRRYERLCRCSIGPLRLHSNWIAVCRQSSVLAPSPRPVMQAVWAFGTGDCSDILLAAHAGAQVRGECCLDPTDG